MQAQLASFQANGFCVVHGALSAEEIAAVGRYEADDSAAQPHRWRVSAERAKGIGAPSVGSDSPALFHRTTALDVAAYHPSVVPLVRQILGPGATLSGLTYVHRLPCDIEPPTDLNNGDPRCLTRQWHREDSGNIEGASRNPFFAPALQVLYYLDDVDAENHCFSVIPESADTKRALPTVWTDRSAGARSTGLRIDDYGPHGQGSSTASTRGSYLHPTQPTWMDGYGRTLARRVGGTDIYAKAGAAVILNNASWHCVTERHTTKHRRTIHVRYRHPEPLASRHALKDPFENVAEYTEQLPDRAALRPPVQLGKLGKL
jgi:hypothetical protein